MSKFLLVGLALGVTTTSLLATGCGGGNAPPMGTELSPSECSDGIDNDGDGATDCDDTGCAAQSFCLAVNDGGVPDAFVPADSFTPPMQETNCTNGVDDDLDGSTDCHDSDCHTTPACGETTSALCHDGLDDDGDGATDCDDSGCASFNEHRCSGSCVANDVSACGSSCMHCAAPAHATATCNGMSCGFTCTTGYTLCGTVCVDLATDLMNCGACGATCGAGGSCTRLVGLDRPAECVGGLYGACTTTGGCGAGLSCFDNVGTSSSGFGFPRGTCTRSCTSAADCSGGLCYEGACWPSCQHGADCRDGYNCFSTPTGEGLCAPLCDANAECGGSSSCNTWTGYCGATLPLLPPYTTSTGARIAANGDACGYQPDGSTNCASGLCETAWTPGATLASRSPTGWANGSCISYCDLPSEWFAASMATVPAGGCPTGSLCVDRSRLHSGVTGEQAGDVGECVMSCGTTADCHEGYECVHPTRGGVTTSNGYCAPIADCTSTTGACPGNYYCDTTTSPPRCHPSPIEHVVLIVQENHTFDSYFGRYCTAAAGTAPACSSGPACCEAAPPQVGGVAPRTLTDANNYATDINHSFNCELCEIDGGAMDLFTDGAGSCPGAAETVPPQTACSNPWDFQLITDPAFLYWSYAHTGALADRYFQPQVGGTSSNDVYFAAARFEFFDNEIMPNALGSNCATGRYSSPPGGYHSFPHATIGDVLLDHGSTMAIYADGYAAALASRTGGCSGSGCACNGTIGPGCHWLAINPESWACVYDASDVPFAYYSRFADSAQMHDYNSFASDVSTGQLADFVYIKFRTYRNEHPSWSYISDGENMVRQVVDAIGAPGSPYARNTLVLLTWDEGGGFYDHVAPPAPIEGFPPGTTRVGITPTDLGGVGIPYGTRVPLLALGYFARPNEVSHVSMEHSSVVRFLEWNFIGPAAQGALDRRAASETPPAGARDAHVNNIGSMIMTPLAPGLSVPIGNP